MMKSSISIFLTRILIMFISITQLKSQPNNWDSRGIGGGGSLFFPSISPHNSSEMYLQCDMSEVFHSTTSGTSWQEVPFQELLSTGGHHTVEFTSDPNVLYTINLDFLSENWFPVKSTDGGITWNAISDPTSGGAYFISADPSSSNKILISSYTQLFYSDDGGASFNMVYDNADDFYIAGVFWNNSDIYVGTQEGLIKSTDAGQTFNKDLTPGIPSGEGFISFTGGENQGVVQLMGTTADEGDLFPGLKPLDVNIYKSIIRYETSQTSWQSAINGISLSHDLFYVASSNNNNQIFYVGGTNTNTSYPVVYKTTDAGANWVEVFLPQNNQNVNTGWSGFGGDEDWWYGEIVFGLAVAPNNPNVVIFTDFGFAHVSNDQGLSWNQAYVNTNDQHPTGSPTPKNQSYAGIGLENTSSWQLTWQDPNTMFASFTDITGIRSTDGGLKWSFNYSGINYNTVYDVVQHPNGTLFAAVSSVHDIYQSTYLSDSRIDGGSGAVLYSMDQGVTWNMLENFGMPVVWLALDPSNANQLYASVVNSVNGGIFKTSDLNNLTSATWTMTATPPRTEGHPYNVEVLNDGTVVSTWSGRRSPGFTASSGVFMSTNGGQSWTDVSMNDEMYYWTKDITIDPNDPNQNTWYVSVHSGWGGPANNKGGLYKTTNRGQNWGLVFNSYRVESATVHPTNADIIYATTEFEGLWYSDNATGATPTFSRLNEYTFAHPMRVFFNPYDINEVWITSFGNGLKVGNSLTTSFDLSEEGENGVSLFPNPSSGEFTINSDKGIKSMRIIDVFGRGVPFTLEEPNKVRLQEKGVYFIRIINSAEASSIHKLVVE